MAHLSHRPASSNDILGYSPHSRTFDSKKRGGQTPRTGSARNNNVSARASSALPLIRPETPIVHRASESHIHRIRAASTRGDFKRNLQSQPPSVVLSKPPKTTVMLSDSDASDVESVKWTSPLDITSYLYKPEYIIQPRSNGSVSSVEKDDWDSVPDTNASPSPSTLQLPPATEDQNSKLEKTELVQNYVKTAIRKEQVNGFYKRQITNCTSFIKEINNEIKEIGLGTKRLEIRSPRTKRVKEPRDEIVQRGYETLKKMYELNADLTESAAKKHICGPPGNHWMGLTRVEILEIMRRIRNEHDVSSDQYNSDDPRMNFTRATSASDKKARKKGKSKKMLKKASTKERKPKNIIKVKAPMVQMQHVHAQHLHTNVCIRPWEPTLDGWNYSYDDEVRDEVFKIEKEPVRRTTSPVENDKFSTSSSKVKKVKSQKSSSSENTVPPPPSAEQVNEEDFITLEIFNPVFKLFR